MRLDITGKVFGKLTAVKPVGKNACEQTLWECVCSCGGTTVKNISYLRRRNVLHSCGCESHPYTDLTGRVFGQLTAVKRVYDDKRPNKDRAALWLCRCSCGRESVVRSRCLLSGGTKTCGDCSYGNYTFNGDDVIVSIDDGCSFTVSRIDYDKVAGRRWWVDKKMGYIVTTENGRIVHLHRLILPDIDGLVCDHKNRNKTDNRRENLRYATYKENSRNRSVATNNTSGYIGVWWHKRKNKYVAGITVDGKQHYLGSFVCADEAAMVRDKAALKHFGEFAVLNFPDEAGVR